MSHWLLAEHAACRLPHWVQPSHVPPLADEIRHTSMPGHWLPGVLHGAPPGAGSFSAGSRDPPPLLDDATLVVVAALVELVVLVALPVPAVVAPPVVVVLAVEAPPTPVLAPPAPVEPALVPVAGGPPAPPAV